MARIDKLCHMPRPVAVFMEMQQVGGPLAINGGQNVQMVPRVVQNQAHELREGSLTRQGGNVRMYCVWCGKWGTVADWELALKPEVQPNVLNMVQEVTERLKRDQYDLEGAGDDQSS